MAPHDEEFDLRVTTLAELGANTHVPAKIRVFVDEDRLVYTNVGRTTDEIAQLLGWGQRSIWMPDHVLTYVQEQHPVLINPIITANRLLLYPDAIYKDVRTPDGRIFIIEGARLRDTRLLISNSVRYVDGIIEERQVKNGSILRMFHLAPKTRHPRGDRLWP